MVPAHIYSTYALFPLFPLSSFFSLSPPTTIADAAPTRHRCRIFCKHRCRRRRCRRPGPVIPIAVHNPKYVREYSALDVPVVHVTQDGRYERPLRLKWRVAFSVSIVLRLQCTHSSMFISQCTFRYTEY